MEQPEYSHTAGRSVSLYNYFGNSLVVSTNVKHIPMLWPSSSAPVCRHANQNCTHMLPKVHVWKCQNICIVLRKKKKYNVSASTALISPKLEITQISINRKMKKWIVVYSDNRHYDNDSISDSPTGGFPGVLVLLCLLTWVLVWGVCSFCESSLSCTLTICLHFRAPCHTWIKISLY